jgi:hypothetical protein
MQWCVIVSQCVARASHTSTHTLLACMSDAPITSVSTRTRSASATTSTPYGAKPCRAAGVDITSTWWPDDTICGGDKDAQNSHVSA